MQGEVGMSTRHMIVRRRDVDRWYRQYPDKAARIFHNLLLQQMPDLRLLLDLFALPAPVGRGRYNHHDGWRP
jgi:hypothetical protein